MGPAVYLVIKNKENISYNMPKSSEVIFLLLILFFFPQRLSQFNLKVDEVLVIIKALKKLAAEASLVVLKNLSSEI